MQIVYGGLDVTADGDGAYAYINPPWTSLQGWPTTVVRFRKDGSPEKVPDAPDMQSISAFALSGYDDIWFAGRPPETPDNLVVMNFNGDEWTEYDDPSEYGLRRLRFFAPNNGWGCENNKIYRFNGTTWYFAGEVPGVDWIDGCDFKSPTDIWAAGGKNKVGGAVLHYTNGIWREVFNPGAGYYVCDVAMRDDHNGWAVGYHYAGNRRYGSIWQCRDGVWQWCICPVEEQVSEVEFVSETEAWAVTSHKILHYTTGVTIAPASFGRIKALYADGRGSDSKGPRVKASRAPATPVSTTGAGVRTAPGAHTRECPTEDAD